MLLPRALLLVVGVVAAVAAASATIQDTSAIAAAFTRQAVESVAATIEREYFDPAVAARLAAMLASGLAHGRRDP